MSDDSKEDASVYQNATEALQASLEARRVIHETRAERFGISVVTPRDVNVLGSRRAASRHGGGFATGFNVLGPEQAEKRAARAARFSENFESEGSSQLDIPRRGGNALESAGPLGSNGVASSKKRVVVSEIDPLESRRDVALGEVGRPCVVHVFGVDSMSTRDVERHFSEYGLSWVEWINDSSLNVTFEDSHTASRVLAFMVPSAKSIAPSEDGDDCEIVCADAPPDRMSDAENAGISSAVAAEGASELSPEFVWRKLVPYKKGNALVPLWMRQGTELDVRPRRPNPKSKWARTIVGGSDVGKHGRLDPSIRDGSVGTDMEGTASASGQRTRRLVERRELARGSGELVSRKVGSRSLRVRGEISKARARKPTLMDVDKALESK